MKQLLRLSGENVYASSYRFKRIHGILAHYNIHTYGSKAIGTERLAKIKETFFYDVIFFKKGKWILKAINQFFFKLSTDKRTLYALFN